jgi:hypothetical protein
MQSLNIKNQHSIPLFSAELFSDTRLSQQQTGGVLLHIEDWLEGVQRSSRQKKPLKSSTILKGIVENKPNLQITQTNITSCPARRYKNLPLHRHAKTNPNKPNSNPKQTHFYHQKPTPNPNKPNQTQNLPAIALAKAGQFRVGCSWLVARGESGRQNKQIKN